MKSSFGPAGAKKALLSSKNEEGVSDYAFQKAGNITGRACRRFAEKMDWQYRDQKRAGAHLISENPEGLHAGRYIRLSLVEDDSTLAVTGGYYDSWGQPQQVYDEAILIGEVSVRKLDRLFSNMKDGLEAHAGLDLD